MTRNSKDMSYIPPQLLQQPIQLSKTRWLISSKRNVTGNYTFFDGNTFSIQLDISADDIEVGEWTVLDEMDITTYFPKEQIWVFIRKSDEVQISAMKDNNEIDYADIYSYQFPPVSLRQKNEAFDDTQSFW